ncbi:hypothetical protein KAJ83_07240 [Marivibrio halodurans]|uniref:Methyltransferase domain-containing protein n=1 Tax=Marivibrio halodurans TaxID=2039722 RepID=A0A8J7V2E4_9PROT|nr:hypothetical protein [Marivibrio halodurans]MBP5856797.1 hypothetical protein [Marivibrio halodurans]
MVRAPSPPGPIVRVARAPISRAVLAFLLSGALTAAAIQALWQGLGIDPPLWSKIVGAGMGAAGFGALFRLPRWWWGVLALAPAAFVGARTLALPGWSYALLAVAALLTLHNSAGERVPLYLTGRASRTALGGLVDAARPIQAIDLGCGLGGPLLAMATANRDPASRFLGVETAPFPFAIAWTRARLAGDRRVTVACRSIWSVDLSAFDLVYAFLSPAPMPRLMAKARRELREGALLVSNEFTDPAYPPDRRIIPEGTGGRPLNLWYAPIRVHSSGGQRP